LIVEVWSTGRASSISNRALFQCTKRRQTRSVACPSNQPEVNRREQQLMQLSYLLDTEFLVLVTLCSRSKSAFGSSPDLAK